MREWIRLLEEAEERDGVHEPDHRESDRVPSQHALDYVSAAVRGRGEPEAAKTTLAPGVHEDEDDKSDRDKDVKCD